VPTAAGPESGRTPRRDRLSGLEIAAAIGLVVFAAFPRAREALLTPLWFDEIWTLWVSQLPLGEMFRVVARDVHPPLHFVLVHFWQAIGGTSDLWVRMLSILFGLALVLVVLGMGRDLFGNRAGLLAAAIIAVHRTHVYISQELRFYGLLWLWLALAIWLGWRWVQTGSRRDGWLYVAVGVCALYTHYLAGLLLGLFAVWGLLDLRREPRRIWTWLGMHMLILVGFAPQIPTFLMQMTRQTEEHWTQPPDVSRLLGLLRHLSFSAYYMIPPMVVAAVLPLTRPAQRRSAALLWSLTVIPVMLTWMLTRAGMHLYHERYMFLVLPFWCALVGAGISGLRMSWRIVAATLVLLLGMRALLLKKPFPEASQLATAATYLRERVSPQDVVFHADTHSLFFFRRYEPRLGQHRLLQITPNLPYYEGVYFIPAASRVGPAAIEETTRQGGRWWAVRTHHGGVSSEPEVRLFDSLGANPLRLGLVTVWEGK
jgi:hypothetical protein